MESRDERAEGEAKTEEREENRKNERDERQRRESRDKIYIYIYIYIFFFFLQYCCSAILKIELHYSKYCKKFTILAFTIF